MALDLLQAIKDGITREISLNRDITHYQVMNKYSLAQKAREELIALLSERGALVSLLQMKGFTEDQLSKILWR